MSSDLLFKKPITCFMSSSWFVSHTAVMIGCSMAKEVCYFFSNFNQHAFSVLHHGDDQLASWKAVETDSFVDVEGVIGLNDVCSMQSRTWKREDSGEDGSAKHSLP
ncbi:hypothetical protein Ancab_039815 [Ancistrocladus abbreviatus]